MKSPIVPCLWFDDQAEDAARFYTSLFPNSSVNATSRYPQSSDNPSGKPRGSVLTVDFNVAGQRFTALHDLHQQSRRRGRLFTFPTRNAAPSKQSFRAPYRILEDPESLVHFDGAAEGHAPFSGTGARVAVRVQRTTQITMPLLEHCHVESEGGFYPERLERIQLSEP